MVVGDPFHCLDFVYVLACLFKKSNERLKCFFSLESVGEGEIGWLSRLWGNMDLTSY